METQQKFITKQTAIAFGLGAFAMWTLRAGVRVVRAGLKGVAQRTLEEGNPPVRAVNE